MCGGTGNRIENAVQQVESVSDSGRWLILTVLQVKQTQKNALAENARALILIHFEHQAVCFHRLQYYCR